MRYKAVLDTIAIPRGHAETTIEGMEIESKFLSLEVLVNEMVHVPCELPGVTLSATAFPSVARLTFEAEQPFPETEVFKVTVSSGGYEGDTSTLVWADALASLATSESALVVISIEPILRENTLIFVVDSTKASLSQLSAITQLAADPWGVIRTDRVRLLDERVPSMLTVQDPLVRVAVTVISELGVVVELILIEES
jgi:hypothetical protein